LALVALVVDTVDGPLARRFGVATVLPRWSGERLDLIVDFLTYVAVLAFALSQADLLYSKTEEGYFVGFPAICNVVCLYLFVLMPPPLVSFAIVAVLIVLTFVPIQCVHPVRVAGLRTVTLLVTAAWGVAAIGAVATPFPSPLWVKVLLIVTAACLTGVGALRSFRGRRAA